MADLVWYPVTGDGQTPATAYTWANGSYFWNSPGGWGSANLLNLTAPPTITSAVPGSGDSAYLIAGEIPASDLATYNEFVADPAAGDPYIGTNEFGVELVVNTPVTIANLTLASFNQYADVPTYPVVEVSGSTLDVTGNVLGLAEAVIPSFGTVTTDGGGAVELAAGGTVSIGGSVQIDVDIQFNDGSHDLLALNSSFPGFGGDFSGRIDGFTAGDTIDLTAVAFTGGQPGTITSGGVLSVTEGTTSYDLHFNTSLAGTTVEAAADTAGHGTDLTYACFVSGTRVLTARGEVAVENLAIGDEVATTKGASPVLWLGHRKADCRRHPRPWDVLPVRIAPGAFSPGVPRRALTLSPDHAVFVDGVLIPVRYLINGATIVQQDTAAVTYWHVELAGHAALLAEGLRCESFLDTGNRASFSDSGNVLRMVPEFARAVWAREGCASLVTEGQALIAVRQRLFDRALAIGHALEDEPDLHLVADGRTVLPRSVGSGRYRFTLDACRALRLVSRAANLAETRPDIRDHRLLGAMVTRIAVRRGKAWRNLALGAVGGAGWHDVEGGGAWRWTDGDAELPAPDSGPAELEVTIGDWAKPWRRPDEVMHAAG